MRLLPLPPNNNKTNLLQDLKNLPRVIYGLLIVVLALSIVIFVASAHESKSGNNNLDSNNLSVDSKKGNKNQLINNQPPITKSIKSFEFPGGKTNLDDNFRYIALYGAPGSPILGALGEQPMPQTFSRLKELASKYTALSKETIYPTLEIITTVASAEPTSNNDFSRETAPATILPWINEAQRQGVYIVLDLQPGHSDFLTQAKEYTSLLKLPNVGLALDPEWRLAPGQVHMEQIGSVSAEEVNQTSEWLADFVKTNKLPQKIFLLHQFRLDMITNRQTVNTSRKELSYIIQMDGLGTQAEKQSTWKAMLQEPLDNMKFGWKNFIDEDQPMLTPSETMLVMPQPWYVSYQ